MDRGAVRTVLDYVLGVVLLLGGVWLLGASGATLGKALGVLLVAVGIAVLLLRMMQARRRTP